MKRSLKIVVLAGVVSIGIGTYLVSSSPKSEQSGSDALRSVLATQDARLTMGSPKARVKIVEYVDVLCPYCAKVHENTFPQIESEYINTKKVHFEVRLVAMISPDSERAAYGAYCAAEQNMFWEYIDTAYQESWENYYSKNKDPKDVPLFSEKNISGFADRIGLERIDWQQCIESEKYKDTLAQNRQTMQTIEAYGTPHFIIGDKHYSGAPPYPAFKAAIDTALGEQAAANQ